MKREDKPLGFLLNYIKPTFEDSLFSKLLDKAEESNDESADNSPTSGD